MLEIQVRDNRVSLAKALTTSQKGLARLGALYSVEIR
jgi:hypothetical protein